MGPVVVEPRDNDVLCGRGGYVNSHPGNGHFRKLVERRKRVYLAARFKREKRLVADSIVSEIRDLEGRFLAKESKTGKWYDIGDEKARDKTSQALRENAPSIRAEIKDGMDQCRNQKPKVEKSASQCSKVQEKSKKESKAPVVRSTQQITDVAPVWNNQTPYYQQPYPCYNSFNEFGQHCAPHTHPQEGGHHGQWHANLSAPKHRPNNPVSSIAVSTFPKNQTLPPKSNNVSATPVAGTWQDMNGSQPNISTKQNTLTAAAIPLTASLLPDTHYSESQDPRIEYNNNFDQTFNSQESGVARNLESDKRLWNENDKAVSKDTVQSSVMMSPQTGNHVMGSWDANQNLFPEESMEEEIGQEVELLEMDYQMEDHRITSNRSVLLDDQSRMAPPPARPKPKVEIDWSAKFGCQSSWLPIPDSFGSPSFTTSRSTNTITTPASYDMDVSAIGTSFTGSVGGTSLCNAFSNDQITEGGTGSISKAHSLISSTHSIHSVSSSIFHQDSFKASFDEQSRSPSFSERSYASKSSGIESQLSTMATSTSIAGLYSHSPSRGHLNVAPLEEGFHRSS